MITKGWSAFGIGKTSGERNRARKIEELKNWGSGEFEEAEDAKRTTVGR